MPCWTIARRRNHGPKFPVPPIRSLMEHRDVARNHKASAPRVRKKSILEVVQSSASSDGGHGSVFGPSTASSGRPPAPSSLEDAENVTGRRRGRTRTGGHPRGGVRFGPERDGGRVPAAAEHEDGRKRFCSAGGRIYTFLGSRRRSMESRNSTEARIVKGHVCLMKTNR